MKKVYTPKKDDPSKKRPWEKLALILPTEDHDLRYGDKALYVYKHSDVAQWLPIEDNRVIISDLVEYGDVDELHTGAKKEFVKACFNDPDGVLK